MSTISIIGSGNMAATIGGLAANHGHTVEILGRDTVRAQALADQIGHGTTVGRFGAPPAGDIVFVAVLYGSAVDVVAQFGGGLSGKILVDITNPFTPDVSGVVTTPGDSIAERIAAVAPDSAHVVKAFNTILRSVLAAGRPLDVFFASDSSEAKAKFGAFVRSLELRPLDAGALGMAHALEWSGVLLVGLASNGAGFDSALGITAV